MQRTVVPTKVSLRVDIKASLIAKKHDTSDRDEQGKVVLLRTCECGQVDAIDFCSDLRIVVKYVGSLREEVAELRVASMSLIGVWQYSNWFPMHIGKAREQVLVFIMLVVLYLRLAWLVQDCLFW